MKDMGITANEIKIVLKILKSVQENYNANSISKEIDISSMGALKILKKLEKEGILRSKLIGKGNFYSLNFDNPYCMHYILFALKRQSEHIPAYIKRWVSEIKKIKSAKIAVLFGSVLEKVEKANDIDVLFVITQENFESLKNEIDRLNKINDKKIHAIYQSKEDFIDNIKKQDKVLLNAIKGIVVFGEKDFVDLIKK